jgi:hypothetical protein
MQHFANGEACYWVPQIRHKVGQGRQHEAALSHAGMRNFERGTLDYAISK